MITQAMFWSGVLVQQNTFNLVYGGTLLAIVLVSFLWFDNKGSKINADV